MSWLILTALSSLLLAADPSPTDPPPKIQIAILLDTSNSMDGLIAQAKSQLWKIVNEFTGCRKDGRVPRLEVALYEYGKSSLPSAGGFIRQILPFTTELDSVSEQLFTLRTNGGEEFCGMVIERAVRELAWSTSPGDLKAIYIAGNEPFTQGKVAYRDACLAALGRGVTVNTIHCGNLSQGEQGGWRDGARIGEGTFANIDQNKTLVSISTPMDDRINQLGLDFNSTCIAYGVAGKAGLMNQQAQDQNSRNAASSDSIVNRSLVKGSENYCNSRWDLLDAIKEGRVKIGDLKKEMLPTEMQSLPPTQWKVHLESQSRRRAEIQKEILELRVRRERYIADQQKNAKPAGEPSLDSVIIEGLRNRATQKGWKFGQP